MTRLLTSCELRQDLCRECVAKHVHRVCGKAALCIQWVAEQVKCSWGAQCCCKAGRSAMCVHWCWCWCRLQRQSSDL